MDTLSSKMKMRYCGAMSQPNSDLPVTRPDLLGLRAELRQTRLDLSDRIMDLQLRIAYLRLYGIVAASILVVGLVVIGRKG